MLGIIFLVRLYNQNFMKNIVGKDPVKQQQQKKKIKNSGSSNKN